MMRADQLHVFTAYLNPRRLQVRMDLLRKWIPHMLDSGVSLTVVEHVQGEQPFELNPDEFPHVNLVQLRGGASHEGWIRDALVNYGFSTKPDAQYLCWEDADVTHTSPTWADDTLHMLQSARVGQTWTHSIDLDVQGNVMRNEWGHDVDRSFCAAWLDGDVEVPISDYCPTPSRALLPQKDQQDWRAHTGYSWAIRRDALNGIGRLLDWIVTGSTDYHMALGFSGKLRHMVAEELAKGGDSIYSAAYYRRLNEFADRCDEHIRQDIGVVPGIVVHGFHGSKSTRMYGSREDVLREAKFDPDKDLVVDAHGIPTIAQGSRVLRDGLRRYAAMRENAARTIG